MKITQKQILIKDLVENYKDDGDDKSTIINGRETYDRIFLEKRYQL